MVAKKAFLSGVEIDQMLRDWEPAPVSRRDALEAYQATLSLDNLLNPAVQRWLEESLKEADAADKRFGLVPKRANNRRSL